MKRRDPTESGRRKAVGSGPNIAVAMATGAKLVVLGRSFIHGVAALGAHGGHHTMTMLKRQLKPVACPA